MQIDNQYGAGGRPRATSFYNANEYQTWIGQVYPIERVSVYFLASYDKVTALNWICIQLHMSSRHILLFCYLNR